MIKISEILLKIFAIGILVCLFAGGLSLIVYVIGLIVGGEIAVSICAFTFKSYLPWVIKFTSVFTGIGLIGMYFGRKKALAVQTENVVKNNKNE